MQIVDTTPVAAMERGEKGSWSLMFDPGEVLTSQEIIITLIDEFDLSADRAGYIEGRLLGALESMKKTRTA